jgi:hypothetical protein
MLREMMFYVQDEWLQWEKWEAVTGLLHQQEAQVLCSSAIKHFLGKFTILFVRLSGLVLQ